MVKKRTPLLLLFGEHPGRCGPLMLRGDREFFRRNFAPFVEKEVAGAGKSALMIHEYNPAVGLDAFPSPEGLISLQMHLDHMRVSINGALAKTLGAGKGLERGMEWFDWGCAEEIIRVNRARPGAIENVIEPLCAEVAATLGLPDEAGRGRAGFGEKLEREKRNVAMAVQVCRQRSATLARSIKALRKEDPERPIIVTRGFAHQGMERFFGRDEFEITSAARLISAPYPSTEAVMKGMSGEITEAELRRYAEMSVHFNEYCESNMVRHVRSCMKDGYFDERRFALLSHQARAHALRMIGG